MSAPKVAFFDFTSCEGCQLTVIDSLQTYPELLEAVEIVNFREAMSEKGEDYQIAFIEGACSRPSDEPRLQQIRRQAALVIALGACAHLGGVNTIRNRMDLQEVREVVYGDKADWYETYPARPIDQVIKVDGAIPGCPIDRHEFIRIVKGLLQGRLPVLPDKPVCVSCKQQETPCVYLRGRLCLGPVIREGCGAICPENGVGCYGCRGMISQPNLEALRQVIVDHGIPAEKIDPVLGVYLTYPLMDLETTGGGR